MKKFSKDQVKKLGCVYTPPDIIKWIHDKLEQYNPISLNKTYWEPACGDGYFVVDWFDRCLAHYDSSPQLYPNLTRKQAAQWIIEKCIYFSDIRQEAVDATIVALEERYAKV